MQTTQGHPQDEGNMEAVGHYATGSDPYTILSLDTGLKPKSTFTPHNINTSIDLFTNLVKKDMCKLRKKHQYTHSYHGKSINFTKQDWLNINNLKKDTSIIIKPADKGGALVIMDRTYYVKEIETQLLDNTNYLPISQDPTHNLKRTLDKLNLWALSKNIISDGEYKYMNFKYPRIPVFYTLPKIHKNPLFPPGRPIVSGTGSIFQHPAEILDKFLIKYVPMQKSYLKDTTTFLTLLADIHIPPGDFWLVTMDVQSLYTSIDHNRGIEAVDWTLDRDPRLIQQEETRKYIRELLTFILTENYFLFGD
ncbi:Hypothetical predicted protein, partial [Pelobates cultripes]